MAGTFIVHAGGVKVTREEVNQVVTPEPVGRYYPIGHKEYVDTVERFLSDNRFKVVSEQHALDKDGARYFGMLNLQHAEHTSEKYGWCLGLRNSHDKSISIRMAAGTKVFVCDNLSFSGEIDMARRHTRHAQSDLHHLLSRAVGRLCALYSHTNERYDRYREHEIRDLDANDIIIRAVENQAINPMDIMDVVKEWREPEHEEFKPRNLWSLFNAVTAVHRDINNPGVLVRRGEALHGLCDSVVGVRPFKWDDAKDVEMAS